MHIFPGGGWWIILHLVKHDNVLHLLAKLQKYMHKVRFIWAVPSECCTLRLSLIPLGSRAVIRGLVSLISTSVDVWMFSSSSIEGWAFHSVCGSSSFSDSSGSLESPKSISTSSDSSPFLMESIGTGEVKKIEEKEQTGWLSLQQRRHTPRPLTGLLQLAERWGYIRNVTVPCVLFADGVSSEDHFSGLGRIEGEGEDKNTLNMIGALFTHICCCGNGIMETNTKHSCKHQQKLNSPFFFKF